MSKISEERNQEFSLRDVLNVLRKNILMIVSIILVCVIFGGVYSKIRKPYYIATEHINYRAQLLYSSIFLYILLDFSNVNTFLLISSIFLLKARFFRGNIQI